MVSVSIGDNNHVRASEKISRLLVCPTEYESIRVRTYLDVQLAFFDKKLVQPKHENWLSGLSCSQIVVRIILNCSSEQQVLIASHNSFNGNFN